MQGKTKTGFKFNADAKCLEDAEFLELYADVSDGDELKTFKLIRKLLGQEQKKALYDHVRDADGRVPLDPLGDELTDILEALAEDNETKK